MDSDHILNSAKQTSEQDFFEVADADSDLDLNELNFNLVKNSSAFKKGDKKKRDRGQSLEAILEQYDDDDVSIFRGRALETKVSLSTQLRRLYGTRVRSRRKTVG